MEAFAVEGTDYLIKPIDKDHLTRALRRARKALWRRDGDDDSRVETSEAPAAAAAKQEKAAHLAAHRAGKIVSLSLDDVACVAVEDTITWAYTPQGKFRLKAALHEIEERLPAPPFVRVSRSTIVNLELDRPPLAHVLRHLRGLAAGRHRARGPRLTPPRTASSRTPGLVGRGHSTAACDRWQWRTAGPLGTCRRPVPALRYFQPVDKPSAAAAARTDRTMRISPRLISRLAAAGIAVLLLPPVLGQEPEPAAAPAQAEAPATPQSAELPPIPDPPRFNKEIAGSVGDVNGDLFWFGQSVNVAGSVLNNALLWGSNVAVDGHVGSDTFIGAGSSQVNGEVMQNVYAFTGQFTVSKDAVIHGNLICMCGTLSIHGTVRGKVMGSGGATTLGGDVGSVDLEVGSLVVSPDAIVRGDLEYRGNDEARIDDGAQIGGEVRYNPDSDDEDDDDPEESSDSGGFSFWSIASTLWWYLANVTVGIAFLLIGGRGARAPVEYLREQAAVGLGFGFVVAVVVPVACLIAFLLLVTLPLGVITMGAYFVGLFLARLVTAQFLGTGCCGGWASTVPTSIWPWRADWWRSSWPPRSLTSASSSGSRPCSWAWAVSSWLCAGAGRRPMRRPRAASR